MLLGGVLALVGAVLNLFGIRLDVLLVSAGCAAIICAAIINGRRSGSFHIAHHVTRIAAAAVLILGTALW